LHKSEFAFLLLWVLGPPIVLGIALLRILLAHKITLRNWRFLAAALILTVIASILAFAFLFAPPLVGIDIGVRDINIFGIHTIWAPFAFIAVVVAFPFAAWWVNRGSP